MVMLGVAVWHTHVRTRRIPNKDDPMENVEQHEQLKSSNMHIYISHESFVAGVRIGDGARGVRVRGRQCTWC